MNQKADLTLTLTEGELVGQLRLSAPTLLKLAPFPTVSHKLFNATELSENHRGIIRQILGTINMKVDHHILNAEERSLEVNASEEVGQGYVMLDGCWITMFFAYPHFPINPKNIEIVIPFLNRPDIDLNVDTIIDLKAMGNGAHIFNADTYKANWSFNQPLRIGGLGAPQPKAWSTANYVMLSLTLFSFSFMFWRLPKHLALVLSTFFAYGAYSFLSQTTYEAPKEQALISEASEVLDRAYLAFNSQNADQLYQNLSHYCDQEALDVLFSELYRELFDDEQTKATRSITKLHIENINISSIHNASKPEEVRIVFLSTWTVTGLVRHRQHVHRKKIQNEAKLNFGYIDGRWKILKLIPIRQTPIAS
jgi:hypothetical protein